ncbi:MAG: hypothetical protein EPN31_06235 [Castellaniella sp.]|uniref:hypothetical protein n=1 Tax=Castellaniella sp. TaxID=1955812 RepID=UPI00121C2F6B|nr:hypothetical protein [Castellaniella sp.]TAN29581.1 MAG: hypothetical protein EPN31_06235 [Castellaniella sp.]
MSAATAIAATAAVLGAGYNIYSGERAASAQKDAQQQAEQQVQQQAQADQATAKIAEQQAQTQNEAIQAQTANAQQTAQQQLNAANPQRPNTSAMLSAIQQAAQGGNGGTMLTGPQGVQPGALTLGKSTLLGS